MSSGLVPTMPMMGISKPRAMYVSFAWAFGQVRAGWPDMATLCALVWVLDSSLVGELELILTDIWKRLGWWVGFGMEALQVPFCDVTKQSLGLARKQ